MMGVGAKRALGLYRSCAPRQRYPTDAHAASGDIDDKQDVVADEPERVHNLDGEQVCRSGWRPNEP